MDTTPLEFNSRAALYVSLVAYAHARGGDDWHAFRMHDYLLTHGLPLSMTDAAGQLKAAWEHAIQPTGDDVD